MDIEFVKDRYGMDRDLIRKQLDKVAERERRAILQQLAAVDAIYRHGESHSTRWILERAHAIALGMRRAGAKLAEEIRSFAIEDGSAPAEETSKWLGYLGDSLIGAHRHRLMAGAGSRMPTMVATSCDNLAAE